MIRIGDFSKLGKVTIKTLRYYDDIGLLEPEFVSKENGYRYYTPDQLIKISKILELKELGLSLDEVMHLMKHNPTKESIKIMLTKKKSQIKNNIQSEKIRLEKIKTYLKNIEEKKEMNKISVKELPFCIVASKRTIIANYSDLHQVAPAMGEIMKKHGVVCSDPAYCFNIYHDEEYKTSDIDVEICEAVVEAHDNADGLEYKSIAAIKTAVCIDHNGPYENLGKSYSEIFKWIESNNYEISDHSRESYIDGCWNKENERDWLTEIQIPVKIKS
jgi:DNA-binding transcriptional MerR regulator/DNA gyrase inhibitor GyrI